MSQCHLCGCDNENEAKYCIQCGANLDDIDVAQTSSEWAATEEFLDLSKVLSSTLDLHLLLRKIDDSAVKLTGASSGSIMLFDEDETALRFRNVSSNKSATGSAPIQDGIAWWVSQYGTTARVNNVGRDRRFTGAIDRITGISTENILCVPVKLAEEPIGVIEALNKDSTEFSEEDEQSLSVLAGQAAVAVKNARLATEQRNFFDHVIEILVMATESTRLVPADHCWRVAKMATAVGRKLKMHDQELQDLYYAAALHDLGMIELRKHGIADKRHIKSHPVLGANIIRDIDILGGTESIIRHHHEYLDGSGYPNGLKGAQIPFAARIIALVEAYEESVQKTESQLITEFHIQKGRARQFEAAAVDALLELVEFQ